MGKPIESEISQSSFRNERHKAVVNLIYTYGFVSGRLQEIIGAEGLTMQQFNILRILRGRHPEPCTNSHIKSRMLDKNSDVTRIVDRLIRNEMAERCSSKEDRRKVEITITDKGLSALSRLDDQNRIMDDIVSGLSNDEVEMLNALLDKIR